MSILYKVLLGVLIVSLVTFIALFGQLPALRKTPIGLLQRVLCIHIPKRLRQIDSTLTGGQITHRSQSLGHYLFYEKNPVVLIAFLFLLTGCAILFLWNATHLLPTHLLIPIPLFLSLPYLFTYLSVTHTAHHITPFNHETSLHDYPYDHVLYRPDNPCRTCELPKPARSKHCSLCGVCVAKADHHCPWVDNCLGRGNYRYFLGLLLTLSILLSYGAYLSWWILRPVLRVNRQNSLLSSAGLQEVIDIFGRATQEGGLSIAGVGMLAVATAGLPLALLGYHCYLIWAGMTTNETAKWADWRDDMADGMVFRASKRALQKHNLEREVEKRGPEHVSNPALSSAGSDEPDVWWPVLSDQMVVRTNDGRPPNGQEALWTRVWNLEDLENLYDLGGWENLLEVLAGH